MSKIRVPIHNTPGKCAVIDTRPAELGVNVYYNGRLLDPREILNSYSIGTTVVRSGGRGGGGGTTPNPPPQGDLTTDDVYEGSRLYFTEGRVQDVLADSMGSTEDITLSWSPVSKSILAYMIDSGVTPGTYGDANHVPRITVDSKGQITHIELVPIALRTDIAVLTEAGDYLCTESGNHLTGSIYTS